jgi:hypothetical protein
LGRLRVDLRPAIFGLKFFGWFISMFFIFYRNIYIFFTPSLFTLSPSLEYNKGVKIEVVLILTLS